MIGGYQIIDLRNVDLEVTESAQSITNAGLLNQLLPLRDFIDKSYNFSKPLENQLKPVLIRFRDKKSGEKIEGSTYGELAVKGNYYTFQITARISGQYTLVIVVAFEEVTDDYGNKSWVIDSATIHLIDASNVLEGDIDLEGDLSVEGLSASGGVAFGDDVSIAGDLEVVGNAILPEINGEKNPSVKPIYCHPIEIFKESTIYATGMILNNSPTPINTWEKLKTAISNFQETGIRRFNISGSFNHETYGVCDAHEIVYNGTNWLINVVDSTGALFGNAINISALDEVDVLDSVNKVN